MQRFIFTDTETGATLELYYVIDVVGLAMAPMEFSTTRGYQQNGYTVNSVYFGARPFSIMFDVRGDNPDAAMAERQRVALFFGSNTPKRFTYKRGSLEVYLKDVYMAGVYDPGYMEKRVYNGTLQFVAASPLFRRDLPMKSAQLEVALKEYPAAGFEFVDGGVEYSTASDGVEIINGGNVNSPAVLRFVGPANSPYIENATTGEKVTVNRIINLGEVLEINSETGLVEIVNSIGERNNAFNYVTEDFAFIHYKPGRNVLRYGSVGGEQGYLQAGGVEHFSGV